MNMNDTILTEVEQLADRMLEMADAWVQNPLAQTTSIEEDTDFHQLNQARDEVKHRKYSILRYVEPEARWQLARRHAVWINEYDLNIVLIDKADPSSAFPGDHVGLECSLTVHDERSLRMYFWCGGLILKVNTMWVHMVQQTHAEDPTIWEVLKFREMLIEGLEISGEFTRRDAVNDGEHTWLFMGTRWEYAGKVLKLDFGRHADERDYFVRKRHEQRSEYLSSQQRTQ